MATENSVLIFQLRYVEKGRTVVTNIPEDSNLRKILIDPSIFKIGIAIKIDAQGINQLLGWEMDGTIDLQGPLGKGFSDLCFNLLRLRFDKGKLKWLRTCNWGRNLEAEWIGYAAADAWIPLIIYVMLTNRYDDRFVSSTAKRIEFPSEVASSPQQPLERWRTSYNNVRWKEQYIMFCGPGSTILGIGLEYGLGHGLVFMNSSHRSSIQTILALLDLFSKEELLPWAIESRFKFDSKMFRWVFEPYVYDRDELDKIFPSRETTWNSTFPSTATLATTLPNTQRKKNYSLQALDQLFKSFKQFLRIYLDESESKEFEFFKVSSRVQLLLSDRQVESVVIHLEDYNVIRHYDCIRYTYNKEVFGDALDQQREQNAETERLARLPYIIRLVFGHLKLHRFDVLRGDKDQWVRSWCLRFHNLEVHAWLDQLSFGTAFDPSIFLPHGTEILDFVMHSKSSDKSLTTNGVNAKNGFDHRFSHHIIDRSDTSLELFPKQPPRIHLKFQKPLSTKELQLSQFIINPHTQNHQSPKLQFNQEIEDGSKCSLSHENTENQEQSSETTK